MTFWLYTFHSQAFALEPTNTYAWVLEQRPTNHQSHFHSYGDLSEPFHEHLLSWVNRHLAKSAKATISLHQQGSCSESALFQSMTPNIVAPESSEIEQQFINSLFIIESSYCLPQATLENTYNVFMSSVFRESYMPQVAEYTPNNYGACIQSSGITGILLPSYYCARLNVHKDDSHILIYSTLDSVTIDDKHEPLYLREEIIVLSKVPNGVALYRASFSRSQDLGTTTKYLLRNTIDNSQDKIRNGLYDMINH